MISIEALNKPLEAARTEERWDERVTKNEKYLGEPLCAEHERFPTNKIFYPPTLPSK
jgi:hypothetical protein